MISLYIESHRESEIARMLTRHQSTVYDVINNYLNRDSLENKQRSGRPKLVTIRDYRKLERLVKSNRRSCWRDISAQFNKNRNTQVSVRSIQHHLQYIKTDTADLFHGKKVIVREVNRRFPANVMALEKTEMNYTRSVG